MLWKEEEPVVVRVSALWLTPLPLPSRAYLCQLREHFAQVTGQWVHPEKVVVQCGVCVDAGVRVHLQQFVQQVAAQLVAHVRAQSLLHTPLLVHGQLHLVVQLEALHARPHVRRERAAQLGDEQQLLGLAAALHDRRPCPHLGHDAPGAPHVHGRSVVAVAEQELWGPVPQGDHAIRVPIGQPVLGHTEGTRESEVGQLEDALFGDQDVGRLHVSVEDLQGECISALSGGLKHWLDQKATRLTLLLCM